MTDEINEVIASAARQSIANIQNRMNQAYIYILTNKRNGTLYTGVTGNLIKRVFEHKHKNQDGFSKKYSCKLLVYFEVFKDIQNAIKREKQIKSGSRAKKLQMIQSLNPEWQDLYQQICR